MFPTVRSPPHREFTSHCTTVEMRRRKLSPHPCVSLFVQCLNIRSICLQGNYPPPGGYPNPYAAGANPYGAPGMNPAFPPSSGPPPPPGAGYGGYSAYYNPYGGYNSVRADGKRTWSSWWYTTATKSTKNSLFDLIHFVVLVCCHVNSRAPIIPHTHT